MKDIAKAIIILAVIYLLLFFLVNTNRQSQVTTEKQSQPVIIADTLTKVIYDTVFIDHFEKVKLPVDTLVYYITDTVKRVDSIFVEIPISKYQFDTCLTTDTTVFNLFIQNLGYDVTLDTLSYSFTYKPTHQKTNFLKEHFKFGLGAGVGYGCFSKQPDVFINVGFYYVF